MLIKIGGGGAGTAPQANAYTEIHNGATTVAVSAWSYNTAEMRYEANVSNSLIRSDTDVRLTLSDAQKGKYSIGALDPRSGKVTIFTDTAPAVALNFTISIWEVGTNGN